MRSLLHKPKSRRVYWNCLLPWKCRQVVVSQFIANFSAFFNVRLQMQIFRYEFGFTLLNIHNTLGVSGCRFKIMQISWRHFQRHSTHPPLFSELRLHSNMESWSHCIKSAELLVSSPTPDVRWRPWGLGSYGECASSQRSWGDHLDVNVPLAKPFARASQQLLPANDRLCPRGQDGAEHVGQHQEKYSCWCSESMQKMEWIRRVQHNE